MTPATCHGKRIAIVLMTAGVALLLGLGICYRDTVRDHVEAWHFQLCNELQTFPPEPASTVRPDVPPYRRGPGGAGARHEIILGFLAGYSGIPVIADAQLPDGYAWYSEMGLWTGETAVRVLGANGWHILEQRLPRRAYVVIRRTPSSVISTSSSEGEDAGIILEITPTIPSGTERP